MSKRAQGIQGISNMRYKVALADVEVDGDTRSIVFFNHGKTETDPDISVAYFPQDKVLFIKVRG